MEIASLVERKFDRKLNIRTDGIREWGKKERFYNRYEPTPYSALLKLFETYRLEKGDSLVDFGSGRGRVSFYIHNHFNIPVTGVEANDKTFEEALVNKRTYRRSYEHLKAPITFEFALAEQYEVAEEDNRFYFFNPFSLKIFQQVIRNIIKSLQKEPREVDLIIYYTLPEIKRFLQQETPFEIINKIPAHKDHGKYGKFVIFRHH